MKKLAFLFPGQGAQHVGMGADLIEEFAVARATFEEADDALGFSLSALCREGPEEALALTENTQPALLATSVATARVLETEGGIVPAIAAGHSLGEWSAWVVAGALEYQAALRAVRERGRLMQAAVAPGVGAMSAVMGADPETVRALCEQSSSEGAVVVPANINGSRQVVVAGHTGAVERLEALAGEARHRTTRLNVSAPFHCPLMGPAAEGLAGILGSLRVSAPRIPVVTNVEARPLEDPSRIVELLLEQITAAVRWEECGRAVAQEAEAGIEVGAGRVLCGLMKRIDRAFPCRPTGDAAAVKACLEEFGA